MSWFKKDVDVCKSADVKANISAYFCTTRRYPLPPPLNTVSYKRKKWQKQIWPNVHLHLFWTHTWSRALVKQHTTWSIALSEAYFPHNLAVGRATPSPGPVQMCAHAIAWRKLLSSAGPSGRQRFAEPNQAPHVGAEITSRLPFCELRPARLVTSSRLLSKKH